jgi:hypothetical protein
VRNDPPARCGTWHDEHAAVSTDEDVCGFGGFAANASLGNMRNATTNAPVKQYVRNAVQRRFAF